MVDFSEKKGGLGEDIYGATAGDLSESTGTWWSSKAVYLGLLGIGLAGFALYYYVRKQRQYELDQSQTQHTPVLH